MYQAPLSREQATQRFDLFAPEPDICYDLFINLPIADHYFGHLLLTFTLDKLSSAFFLDYAGDAVSNIIINGKLLDTNDNYQSLRKDRHLYVPESELKNGQNSIELYFQNRYSNDGCGLHHFTDIDTKHYIYSQSKPYHANKIFPMFDQPDLKAKFNLKMIIPKTWVGISNQPLHSETDSISTNIKEIFPNASLDNTKVIIFDNTPYKISTYLFAVFAGDYKEIKSEKMYQNIPMTCYCRDSLFNFLKPDVEDIFKITIECMKFYEDFFGYPLPFSKYDHIFCPEYIVEEMANPGAATYNDDIYIFKEPAFVESKTKRAVAIAHGLACMWFGGLVTMKWWNDLWLNEATADVMAHYCISLLRESFLSFLNIADGWFLLFKRKFLSYVEDQYRTAHPIAGKCANTAEAETNLDYITSAKGAAALKQLMCLMSEKAFSEALRVYFKKYAWGNTTMDIFIDVLKLFYEPIFEWQKEWLCTTGLNECAVEWDPFHQSKTATLTVKQTPASTQCTVLRQHKMKVVLFDESGKICEVKDFVLSNKGTTVVTYDGTKAPQALVLNFKDETYIKIRLDDTTVATLVDIIWSIEDDLTKALMWSSLWDMTRDSLLNSHEFMVCVERNILSKNSDNTLSTILSYSQEAIEKYTTTQWRGDLSRVMFDNILRLMVEPELSIPTQKILLKDMLISFAKKGDNFDHVKILIQWLNGEDEILKKVELSLKNKWDILEKIYCYQELTTAEKQKYYEKVASSDKTNTKIIMHQKLSAIIANKNERETLWKNILDNNLKESLKVMTAIMNGFSMNLAYFADDAEKYYNDYFKSLLKVFKTQNREYAKVFFKELFPKGEKLKDYDEIIKKLIEQVPTEEVWLLKMLKESSDNLQRRIKAYEECDKFSAQFPELGDNDFAECMF